jgi:hypothetical protein
MPPLDAFWACCSFRRAHTVVQTTASPSNQLASGHVRLPEIRHWGSGMDSGADLIRQEWQQKKNDVDKELADLRDWMRAHSDDGPGHTDATKKLIGRLERLLADLDKLLAGELTRP